MADVMIDAETWGTRPGCAVRSIGAVVFNPNGEGTGEEFYANIDDFSCDLVGLTQDPNTVAWWARQSAAAQEALLVDPKPLGDALWEFNAWWERVGGVRMWCHGANFDGPVLEAAYHAEGTLLPPWKFWDSRCTRTLFDIAQVDTKAGGIRRTGTHHNALDDAKFQALCVQAGIRRLFGRDFAAKTSGVFA